MGEMLLKMLVVPTNKSHGSRMTTLPKHKPIVKPKIILKLSRGPFYSPSHCENRIIWSPWMNQKNQFLCSACTDLVFDSFCDFVTVMVVVIWKSDMSEMGWLQVSLIHRPTFSITAPPAHKNATGCTKQAAPPWPCPLKPTGITTGNCSPLFWSFVTSFYKSFINLCMNTYFF